MTEAKPRDFASFAPLVVEHARREDPAGRELMRLAAGHIDALAARLLALGPPRLSLVGGLAPHVSGWLAPETLQALVPPTGDALSGALRLAREHAEALGLA
jgi:glucosamine kinase